MAPIYLSGKTKGPLSKQEAEKIKISLTHRGITPLADVLKDITPDQYAFYTSSATLEK